jgi:tellurite resistance protein TehA-like permease
MKRAGKLLPIILQYLWRKFSKPSLEDTGLTIMLALEGPALQALYNINIYFRRILKIRGEVSSKFKG